MRSSRFGDDVSGPIVLWLLLSHIDLKTKGPNMTDPKKFFTDNISLIGDSRKDPIGWNLNCGLLALAQQLQTIQNEQDDLRSQMKRIERLLQSR